GGGIFKCPPATGWKLLADTDRADFSAGQKICVSDTAPNRVYAVTSSGIFRSVDGGEHWGTPLVDGRILNGCMDVVMQPKRPAGYVFASCGNSWDRDGAIWRAQDTDGPQNWQMVLTARFMK